MVEMAVVLGFLLVLVIGAAEMAFAFRDSTIVSNGTRESARVAAAIGDEPNADCVILEAGAGALHDIADDQVLRVVIFEAYPGGGRGSSNVYRPSVDTDDASALVCGTWFPISLGWPESSRDNQGFARDWAGVEIIYDHDWRTGFAMWQDSVCDRGAQMDDCWREETIMHLEPAAST